MDLVVGGGHTAAADLATLYSHTVHWFTAERNYKGKRLCNENAIKSVILLKRRRCLSEAASDVFIVSSLQPRQNYLCSPGGSPAPLVASTPCQPRASICVTLALRLWLQSCTHSAPLVNRAPACAGPGLAIVAAALHPCQHPYRPPCAPCCCLLFHTPVQTHWTNEESETSFWL